MNTAYLKTFIEVVNLKNISKAAEKLFVTQPAVTKQLQLLEKEFGAELLRRNGREIIPTDEGNLLYQYAKNVLSEENKIYSIIKKDDDKLHGNLEIFTSSLPADYYIHDLIIEFNSLYPDVRYTIKKVDSDMVFKNIDEGFTGFGFTGAPSKNKKIKNICIAEDEVVIVASAKKQIQYDCDEITLEMLLKEKFILRENGSATLHMFESFLNKNKIRLNDLDVIMQAEDNEVIKRFILSDLGIAVISKKAVEKEIFDKSMFILNLKDTLKRQLYFVYHQDRYFSNIEEKFKGFMIGKFQ